MITLVAVVTLYSARVTLYSARVTLYSARVTLVAGVPPRYVFPLYIHPFGRDKGPVIKYGERGGGGWRRKWGVPRYFCAVKGVPKNSNEKGVF